VSAGGHDRRSFFRELLRGASSVAREVESFRRGADDAVRQWGFEAGHGMELRPVPATPTTRCATVDDLRGLCADIGRETWADHAVSVACTSIRWSPGGDGSSWLGGSPGIEVEWPEWAGGELAFAGRLRLAGLPATGLPHEGALLVFHALDRAPSGMRPDEGGACRVIHVADDHAPDEHREGGLRRANLTASGELTLPAVPGPGLDLDVWELEDWAELRERLAELQGVELEESAADYHALHRLLGQPDTFAADMALDAHLVSEGVDLEEEPYANILDEDLARRAADWRLLVQLSNDDTAGIDFGDLQRLYVWIRDDDLAAARFDRVRAFVR